MVERILDHGTSFSFIVYMTCAFVTVRPGTDRYVIVVAVLFFKKQCKNKNVVAKKRLKRLKDVIREDSIHERQCFSNPAFFREN